MAYTDVAEVSYNQRFADGSVESDVVRLVYAQGSWRWFFGRAQAWVEQQNLRFNQKANLPEDGVAPFRLDTITKLDAALLNGLPQRVTDPGYGRTFELVDLSSRGISDTFGIPTKMIIYRDHDHYPEFPLAVVILGDIVQSGTAASHIDRLADMIQNSPPTMLRAWNTKPDSGLPWVLADSYANDAKGMSISITLATDTKFLDIQTFSESSFELIATALAN